jgi:pyruvyltransferase
MRGQVKAYWYRGEGGLNFGDALNPLLFQRLAHVTLEWVPPGDADLFAIGSNIEMIPDGYRGWILGTGIAGSSTRRDLSGANVLCVRGNLTAACCNVGDVLLADLGLLASDLLDHRPEQDIEEGIIRHFADPRPTGRWYEIDVLGGPEHVIYEAARCKRITSSSLHGLVLADALGIPSRWSPHQSTMPVKYEDYLSSFKEILQPYGWRLADQGLVAAKQESLREILRAWR